MKFGPLRIFQTNLIVIVWLFTISDVCSAQWSKTIDCPEGRIYQDERPYAGRNEYCDLELPGSLRVKDGPFRSWFSQGNPGSEGKTPLHKKGLEQWSLQFWVISMSRTIKG